MNVLSVYATRAKRIRNYLSKNDLQALVVLDSLNTIYISGFHIDVDPWERPVATVIPLDADPFIILNELSINHYRYALESNTVLIEDARFYDEHPRLTKRRYYTQEFGLLLSETLEEKDIIRGRIGVDSSPLILEGWIKTHLPELHVIEAGKLLREMRLIKDEYELDLIRKAGELSTFGQERLREIIAVGRSEVGIGTEVAHLVAEEAANRYPDYCIEVAPYAFTGTGPQGAMPHGWRWPCGRKIKNGDSLLSTIVLRLNKYCVENERTYFMGRPTDKQKRFFEVVTEAQRRGLEMCVAGNKVSDIDAAALKVIEDAGYGDYVFHRTGHGMGLGGHEYWDNMAFNHRILEPRMVTSVEPMLCVYGLGGFRHSDTVIVGKEKAEVVTKYTKELDELTLLP